MNFSVDNAGTIFVLKSNVLWQMISIRTSRKFVYLDKIFVITNALQVRMVCHDLTKLQMYRRQNLSRVKIGQNRLNKQKLFILSLIYVIKLLTV